MKNEFAKIAESMTFDSVKERNEYLAKKLGLSVSAIKNLIAGRNEPKQIHIIAINAIKRQKENKK